MNGRLSFPGLHIAIALAVILFTIPISSAGASAKEAPKEFEPSYMYAVNLASSIKPVDPFALPVLEAFDEYLVYTTSFKKGGLTWHRLRIGFFPTKEAAKEAMRPFLKDFPEAWVTKVSTTERASSKDYALFPRVEPEVTGEPRKEASPTVPAPPTVAAVPPVPAEPPAPPAKPPAKQGPALLMEKAELATTNGDFSRAVRLYKEVLKHPDTGFRKEAHELLGLAYERKGDLAQAKAEYKTYLVLYPGGGAAERVRQRLAGLTAAKPVEKLEKVIEKKPAKKLEKKKAAKKPEIKRPEKRRKSKEGFFLGAGVTRVIIGGYFDGSWSIVGGGATDALPDLGTATGMKFIAGYQFRRGSLELNYSRSDHDGIWLGLDKPSTLRSYSLDGKLFIFRDFYRVQPLLSLGGGYNIMTVQGGSTDGVSTQDSRFKGWDLRLGGGVEIPLHEHIAIDLLAIYRYGVYNSVDGIASGGIDGHVDGNGPTFSIDAKFIF